MKTSKSGLTPAKKRFALEYAKTDNGRRAALKVYPHLSLGSAGTQASRLLKNVDVSKEIEAQKAKMEYLASKAVIKIDKLLESDDENVATKNAWKVYEQVHGKPVNKSVNLTANISLEDALSTLS